MQVLTLLNIYDKIIDKSIITIGNFDGVHLGHAEIFAHLKKISVKSAIPSVIVTFEPHPLKLLAPELAPLLITTYSQKIALIEEYGIDYLVVIPFTTEFSELQAADFVSNLLCNTLGMKHIIIGHDYAFGKNRGGNFKTLQELGDIHGFTLEDIPPIGTDGIIFSSSLVRSAVANGHMEIAFSILGRYYQIYGTVVHGHKIGHSLGFPTANILTANELIPLDGVYSVIVQVDGQMLKGACNIGNNPTFNAALRSIEVFILDFKGDIYGHAMTIFFVKRLREVRKFGNIQFLKAAVAADIERSRMILEKLTLPTVRDISCALKN